VTVAILGVQGKTITWSVAGINANLTGYTVRMALRSAATWQQAGTTPDLELTEGAGLTVTRGATSQVDVAITPVQADALSGVYVWDLQVTSGGTTRLVDLDGNSTLHGSLTVDASATRTRP
jgi:hypothetical protein